MIEIMSIRDLVPGNYDAAYAIVRSMKHQAPGLTQLDVLSPSWDLFKMYRELVDEKSWNKESFAKIYMPHFLFEMRNNPKAISWLNRLYLESKVKKIALCCFCGDESLCHRSIIGGMLQGAGADVKMASGEDYSRYFGLYRAIR